jgi:hypothetical protein
MPKLYYDGEYILCSCSKCCYSKNNGCSVSKFFHNKLCKIYHYLIAFGTTEETVNYYIESESGNTISCEIIEKYEIKDEFKVLYE